MFARIELRATAAPETIPAAPAKYIARLVIDPGAGRPEVTTYIYFDSEFQGAPMTVDITDFSAALVYRCLVAGSLRLALKTARVLDAGKDSIKQRLKVDLNRNLKLGATRWRYDAAPTLPDFSLTTN